MALQVNSDYTTPHGLTVNSTYWRWTGLQVDVVNGLAAINLFAYVSAEAFAAGKQHIGSKTYQIGGADFVGLVTQARDGGSLSETISAAIYEFVMATDGYFAGAVPV